MGVMCVVWRSRLTVSIILVLVVCGVCASDGAQQPIGKVYPRGNHWAVGHLMGKKSTDEQRRLGDAGEDVEKFIYQHDLRPLFLRVLERSAGARTQETGAAQLIHRLLETARQWEEDEERDRQLKQEEQLFLQAFGINDESS